MPSTDDGYLTVSVELQSGTNVNQSIIIARQIDSIFYANFPDEIDLMATSTGSDESGGIAAMFTTSGSNIINFDVGFVDADQRERSITDLAEVIRVELEKIPGISNFNISAGGGMAMTSSTVDVEIFGYDIEQTTLLANQVAERLETLNGARDIQISREKAKPELRVELDREKMAGFGLNTATVSTALYNRIIGMTATRFRESGDEYNVVIRLKKEYRNSITDIENITFASPTGSVVRLSEIANIREYYSPPNMKEKEEKGL
jgi:HAE1 family hydrophobic/amphiphilic exporter-1